MINYKGYEFMQNHGFLSIYCKHNNCLHFNDFIITKKFGLSMKLLINSPYTVLGLTHLVEVAKKYNVGQIQINSFKDLGGVWKPYLQDDNKCTLLVELKKPIEEILKGMTSTHRKRLRKQAPYEVRVAESMDDFNKWFIIYKKLGQQKRFRTANYGLLKELFIKKMGTLFISIYNDRIIGGLFLLGNNRWVGGSTDECKKLGGDIYLDWYIIKYLKKHGFDYYDLAGATVGDGIYNYKKGFGSIVIPLYTYIVPINKWKNKIIEVFQ